ncbi:MAG: dockerin type I domain-containing protein [Clostridia bacterium]|nr:dockerin type I domain-containing protein [Clostridia bacterium]
MWKIVVASVLALSMLPMVALGEGSANTVALTSVDYNDETEVMTVTGTITAGADAVVEDLNVTILAVRGTQAEGESETALADFVNSEVEGKTLQDRVVYIDQVGQEDGNIVFNEGVGTFTFNFKPKVDAKGGQFITVFAGGTDVTEVQKYRPVEAAPASPHLKLQGTWYKGEDLVFDLVKDATNAFPEIPADYTSDIDKIIINKGASQVELTADKFVVDAENKTATIAWTVVSGIETISSVDVEMKATYANGKMLGEAFSASMKASGTVTIADQVADGEVEFSINAEGAYADWATDIALPNAIKISYMDGETPVEETATAALVEGNNYKFAYLFGNAVEERTFTITIQPDEYYTATEVKSFKLTAPTKIAADAAVFDVVYGGEAGYYDAPAEGYPENADEKDAQYGKAVVDLKDTWGEDGVSIVWAWTSPSMEGASAVGKVELARPAVDAEEDTATYSATATFKKDGYADSVKTFDFVVNKIGLAGVDVEVNAGFISSLAKAANVATVKLYKESEEIDAFAQVAENGVAFKSTKKIALGDYIIEIARPGYFTETVEVTVTKEGVTMRDGSALAMPAMRAGDIDANDTVNILDISALGSAWNAVPGNAKYNVAADLNGDGIVNVLDYSTLGSNWNASK